MVNVPCNHVAYDVVDVFFFKWWPDNGMLTISPLRSFFGKKMHCVQCNLEILKEKKALDGVIISIIRGNLFIYM